MTVDNGRSPMQERCLDQANPNGGRRAYLQALRAKKQSQRHVRATSSVMSLHLRNLQPKRSIKRRHSVIKHEPH